MTPSNPKRRALITGVTGQDGAYLAEFLLAKGYEVHGIKRRSSSFNTDRIDHLYQDPHAGDLRLILHYGDLTDSTNLIRIVQSEPDDLVIATGVQHSVREFVEHAAARLGMQIEWRGEGRDAQGIDAASGRVLVRVDPRYFRPTEVEALLGDAGKARARLGWVPEISFEQLVEEMVSADLEHARRGAMMRDQGFRTVANRE